MRNDYRLIVVDGRGEVVRKSDAPKLWGAERIFEKAKLPRGHTIRLYRRRGKSELDYKLLRERGHGPKLGVK